jgi:SNF2 family DNA or RNA helicase
MWEDEVRRWYGWTTLVISGSPLKRKKLYAAHSASPAQCIIMGYETFRTDRLSLTSFPVASCICDESGKIRTPTAKVSRAVRAFRPPVRIALDGTPVSNSIADLWSPVEWIAPMTFYGNWWIFRKQHAVMNSYIPGKIDGWRDEPSIINKANRHIFWKKKMDVLHDLPPLTVSDIPLTPTDEEKKTYDKIREELRVELIDPVSGTLTVPITNALALLMRLRQAANGEWNENNTKTQAVLTLIDALPLTEKVVIFTQFESVAQRLMRDLPYRRVSITGIHAQVERERALRSFQTDPSIRCLIMTNAGERGINAQCASYMIQYDLAWSYAATDQRIGRIWRHGQQNPCLVYNLLMRGTVDFHMRRILRHKEAVAANAYADNTQVTAEDIGSILGADPLSDS